MAARTRQITDQSADDTPAIDAAYDDVSGLVDAQEKMENDINAEIGTPDNDVRWQIKVYRVEPNGKELTYLFQIVGESIEGLSDRLRDQYGSGKYMVRVYKNSKLHKAPVMKVEAAKNAPAPQINPQGDALVALVQQLGASQQALLQQVASLKATPPAAPMDAIGMFTGMAAMMEAMRKFMPAPAPAESPMKLITEVIGMAKELSDTGREKGMFDIVSDALNSPLFARAVESAQQPQAPQIQQRPPRPQIPAAPAGTQPPAAPAPAAPAQNEDEAKFSALLEMLITRAASNSDVALYADLLEDMIDRPTLDGLLGLPDPVGTLIQYNPKVATYRVWFVSLIEALTDGGDEAQIPGAPDHVEPASNATGRAPAPIAVDVAT